MTSGLQGRYGSVEPTREPHVENDTQSDIEQLNSFLRAERSAVEAYSHCIGRLSSRGLITLLSDLQQSHHNRVKLLSERISALGGSPSDNSYDWGSVAQLFETATNGIGERAALLALEEGEDTDRQQYERDLVGLTPETRSFIATKILPEQRRSQDMLIQLKGQL